MRLEGNDSLVQTDEGRRLSCFLPKTLRREARQRGATALAVGDRVILEPAGEDWRIVEVEPRRSSLSRRRSDRRHPFEDVLVANPDRLLVVAACDQPRLNPRFVDRLLCAGEHAGLECVLVVNKLDLAEPVVYDELTAPYRAAGYPTLGASVVDGRGIDELRGLLAVGLSLLAGKSGTGKSSLLNACDPTFERRVGSVSDYSSKGRHTTTSPELLPVAGGYVADTPGVRVFGLWDVRAAELAELFPEFAGLVDGCRFADCLHRREPGCAVRDAVETGRVYPQRYASYLALLEELEAEARLEYK